MFDNSTSVVLIRFLLIVILTGINLSAYCQVTVLEKTVFLLGDLYDLKVQKREEPQGDNVQEFYIFKAKQGDKESKALELKSLEKVLLDAALKKVLLEATDDKYLENGTLKTGDEKLKNKFEADIKEISNSTYPEIMVAAIRVAEYEPVAGEIYIHDKAQAFFNPTDVRSKYSNYKYRVKNIPLLSEDDLNFELLTREFTQRKRSLDSFIKKIETVKGDVTKLETNLYSLNITPANDVKIVPAINSDIVDLNNQFSNETDIKFDKYIFYYFLNPANPFIFLKKSTDKDFKEKERKKAITDNFNKIAEYLGLFSLLKRDVDNLLDLMNDLERKLKPIQNEYISLKDKTENKRDSLSNNLYTFIAPAFTQDSVKKKISQLELEQSKKVDELNKLIIAFNPKLERNLYNNLTITKVNIEFNEGFIENITVRGFLDRQPNRNDNAPLEFTNNYPIGFSSKKDFDFLATTKLFEKRGRSSRNNLNIYLDDIFDYDYNLDLNTRDYSPHNGAYAYLPTERKQLTKIESSKILEAKVFTDLVGIDVEKPNGLIQTEVSRRMNINSRRYANYNVKRFIFFGKKVIFLKLKQENINYGYFSYIEPVVAISKIEEDNRRLPLNNYTTIINGQIYNRNYIPMLRLREYQHLSVGTDLNLFLLDLPRVKSTFLLNAGLRFGRTALADTTYRINEGISEANETVDEFGVSTLELFPEISCRIQPERRYGFTFSDRISYFNLLNPTILQVAEEPDFDREESINKNTWFNTFELLGFLNLNQLDNGRLFFRYRLFSNLKTPKTNFYQAQLGFSFFLLSRNQPKSKLPVN